MQSTKYIWIIGGICLSGIIAIAHLSGIEKRVSAVEVKTDRRTHEIGELNREIGGLESKIEDVGKSLQKILEELASIRSEMRSAMAK